MTRKIIIYVLLSVVLLSLGTLNLSCTNNANAENEPKPANVSLDNYYTKDEIDTMLSEYYLKGVSDALYYQKTEVDTELAKYYQKTEVDNFISSNKSSIIYGINSVGANDETYTIFHRGGEWEEFCQFAAPMDGVLRNLFAVESMVSRGPSYNVEITVRINETDTPLTLNYAAEDIGSKGNTTDSVTVNQGDLISIVLREIGGASSDYLFVTFLFDADI